MTGAHMSKVHVHITFPPEFQSILHMFNAHLQVSPRAASPRFAAHWIQARVLHQHDGVSPKSLVKVPHAHQAHLSVPIIVPRTIIIAST